MAHGSGNQNVIRRSKRAGAVFLEEKKRHLFLITNHKKKKKKVKIECLLQATDEEIFWKDGCCQIFFIFDLTALF